MEWKRKDKEGKEKQEKISDIIAKLMAAAAVSEGQVEQQKGLINHQCVLFEHTQTIATHAIKYA